ncbi:MAG TPA: TrmH family RNA methyltransferase [Arenimonas sp.]|nr:TrmH family RNA methyltransferase [Arenimonas sp.]
MTDSKDENPLYRGPSPKREDSRGPRPPRRDDERSARPPRRAEERSEQPSPRAYPRQEPGAPRPRYAHDTPRAPQPRREREDYSSRVETTEEAFDQRPAKIKEFRIYGLNACLAAFKKRPESIRKLWLLESRIPKLTELLAFCVKNRIGYNVVENEDLEKLTASAHHEGVCLAVLPQPELALSTWLMSVPEGPCLLIWLDGVGNPHNLGAIMRSAAHFGVQAILLPKQSQLANSGAAARVAEGAAEYVPLVRLGRNDNAIAQLRSVGFELVTTVVRGGSDLFNTALPKRCVLVMGAEQAGVEAELLAASKLRVEIPGSGHVDSLNVSAATAVLLAEWRRQTSR